VSFLVGDRLFTGDALFVRGTGRTDFQQGNPRTLYKSVTGKLFSLPPETRVYPGHDYRGFTHSTIQEEREFNPRLGGGRSEDEFVRIMSELKLPNPKQIHEAVPANLACGQKKEQKMKAQMVDGVPEVSPEQVEEARKTTNPPRLIDCRFDNEFVGELGHVPGSELVTLGDELMKYLQDGAPAKDKAAEIVFICRSGNRSGHATMLAQQLGYKNVYNMSGGMILWNELRLPVERDARR
jgi:rhodanese-related sulfurtransferase